MCDDRSCSIQRWLRLWIRSFVGWILHESTERDGQRSCWTLRITYHVTESVHAQGEGVNTQVSLEIVLLDFSNIGFEDGSSGQRENMRGWRERDRFDHLPVSFFLDGGVLLFVDALEQSPLVTLLCVEHGCAISANEEKAESKESFHGRSCQWWIFGMWRWSDWFGTVKLPAFIYP